MKNFTKELLKLFAVLLSIFAILFLFGWLAGAKSNPNPRNEYNSIIESYEDEFVNNELEKLNDE